MMPGFGDFAAAMQHIIMPAIVRLCACMNAAYDVRMRIAAYVCVWYTYAWARAKVNAHV